MSTDFLTLREYDVKVKVRLKPFRRRAMALDYVDVPSIHSMTRNKYRKGALQELRAQRCTARIAWCTRFAEFERGNPYAVRQDCHQMR